MLALDLIAERKIEEALAPGEELEGGGLSDAPQGAATSLVVAIFVGLHRFLELAVLLAGKEAELV